MLRKNPRVQRVARPVWFPVSLFLTLVLVAAVVAVVGWVVDLPSMSDSTAYAVVVLFGVFVGHYYVWSIPVRLGWVTPPPEFRRGEDDAG